ncbi:hypothetical protein PC116_g29665 [Phytophthora cactorum]|nr:hypothetical protein PC116_g29665 [Phytophthora cactorum]
MALGLQGLLVALLWLFIPDCPANDPGEMSYLPCYGVSYVS